MGRLGVMGVMILCGLLIGCATTQLDEQALRQSGYEKLSTSSYIKDDGVNNIDYKIEGDAGKNALVSYLKKEQAEVQDRVALLTASGGSIQEVPQLKGRIEVIKSILSGLE